MVVWGVIFNFFFYSPKKKKKKSSHDLRYDTEIDNVLIDYANHSSKYCNLSTSYLETYVGIQVKFVQIDGKKE